MERKFLEVLLDRFFQDSVPVQTSRSGTQYVDPFEVFFTPEELKQLREIAAQKKRKNNTERQRGEEHAPL